MQFTRYAIIALAVYGFLAPVQSVFAVGVPEQVVDINTSFESADIGTMISKNDDGFIYFFAEDSELGMTLWKYLPEEDDVIALASFASTQEADEFDLTVSGDKLYFVAQQNGDEDNRELWKSDGTAEGTTMVKDIMFEGGSSPEYLTDLGGTLLFTAESGFFGRELWKSDGTEEGTVLVEDIAEGSIDVHSIVAINDYAYISLDDGFHGVEPWMSNGTEEGTFLMSDINEGSEGSFPEFFTQTVNGVVFTADDGVVGNELWIQGEGAALLAEIVEGAAGIQVSNSITIGDNALFALDDGVHGEELWASDGTNEGTTLVKDVHSGPNGSNPEEFKDIEGALIYSANDGESGQEVWTSDGTEVGTNLVLDVNEGVGGSYPSDYSLFLGGLGGVLVMIADDGEYGREVMAYGGVDATHLTNINPNGDSIRDFFMVSLGGGGVAIAYNATDGVNGHQLWSGADIETRLVKQFTVPDGTINANPEFISAGDSMIGAATNNGEDTELWISNGTEEGTRLVKNVNPTGSSNPSNMLYNETSGKTFFTADDGINGIELWVTDGTPEGTTIVENINATTDSSPYGFVLFDNLVYFVANDGVNGYELWVTDGTPEGTLMVEDINVGGNANPDNLTRVGDTLFFTADDAVHGVELWKVVSGGDGAELVEDINEGAPSASIYYLVELNGKLYFNAEDGTSGMELWESDGTPEGTDLVVDICEGICNGQPSYTVEMGGYIYFVGYDINETGVELWRSDGTAENTTMIKDINPGIGYSNPRAFNVVGSQLFFSADDGSGVHQLWKTDGTEAGTVEVADMADNDEDGNFSSAAIKDGQLYFTVYTTANGYEPWVTDGTPEGTQLLADIYSGTTSSEPRDFIEYNGDVYFSAESVEYGRELWRVGDVIPEEEPEEEPEVPVDDDASITKVSGIRGGRIKVTLDDATTKTIQVFGAVSNKKTLVKRYKDTDTWLVLSGSGRRLALVNADTNEIYSKISLYGKGKANSRAMFVKNMLPKKDAKSEVAVVGSINTNTRVSVAQVKWGQKKLVKKFSTKFEDTSVTPRKTKVRKNAIDLYNHQSLIKSIKLNRQYLPL